MNCKKDANKLGIKALQVCSSKRAFIMASKPSNRYSNVPGVKLLLLITLPKLLKNLWVLQDSLEH